MPSPSRKTVSKKKMGVDRSSFASLITLKILKKDGPCGDLLFCDESVKKSSLLVTCQVLLESDSRQTGDEAFVLGASCMEYNPEAGAHKFLVVR